MIADPEELVACEATELCSTLPRKVHPLQCCYGGRGEPGLIFSPRSWFRPALLLISTCLPAVLAAGGSAYLPAAGPAPVRFQTASRPAPEIRLPPLVLPQTQVAQNVAPVTNAPASDQAHTTVSTDTVQQAPASETAPPNPNPREPASSPPNVALPFSLPGPCQKPAPMQAVVDPLNLLNYFLAVSTNELGAKVVMPVFIPPAPPSPAHSSHATYESP